MKTYDTVTEAVQDLKARGYSTDFNVAYDKVICAEKDIYLTPEEFEIVEVYRFEGESNPSDEDVVYAIESRDGNHKGVITSAFGPYADSLSNELVQKLSMHRNQA